MAGARPASRCAARFDSGFYSGRALFGDLKRSAVTYLCGVPMNRSLVLGVIRQIPLMNAPILACLDKDEGEIAEFGYRMRDALSGLSPLCRETDRRSSSPGEQASFETGIYRYWVFVTNDHERSVAELESEHRHKADVEAGMRELKSNFGLGTRSASTASWRIGPGCCSSVSATTSACGPNSSDVSGPDETAATYGPSDFAIAIWPSPPWWSAAVGASRCGFTPVIPTSSSSALRSIASRLSGPLPPEPSASRVGANPWARTPWRGFTEPVRTTSPASRRRVCRWSLFDPSHPHQNGTKGRQRPVTGGFE